MPPGRDRASTACRDRRAAGLHEREPGRSRSSRRARSTRVVITLQALEIVANFDSTPPGAKVALVVDGKRTEIGVTPTTAKIDPRNHYDVVFAKDGYVEITKPLTISGAPEEKVVVNLERGPTQVATGPVGGPVTSPDPGRKPGGGTKPPGGGTKPPPDGDPTGDPPTDPKPPVDKPPVDQAAGRSSRRSPRARARCLSAPSRRARSSSTVATPA
jgi:hypothetical protein